MVADGVGKPPSRASLWTRAGFDVASYLTPSNHGRRVIDASNDARERPTDVASNPSSKHSSKRSSWGSSRASGGRTPRESRSGTSCSPLAGFAAFAAPAPGPAETASTNRCLLRPSSSSATSTRSATSSPKSPTCASAFIERVVALARRRSVLERGTRVKRSSSIFARASMRANSRFAKALAASPSSPPSSSGASPSSCASSCDFGGGRGKVGVRFVSRQKTRRSRPWSSLERFGKNASRRDGDGCPALDWELRSWYLSGTLPKIWYVCSPPRDKRSPSFSMERRTDESGRRTRKRAAVRARARAKRGPNSSEANPVEMDPPKSQTRTRGGWKRWTRRRRDAP